MAIHLPRLGPNSVLFWALLPLGTGAGAWFVSDAWHRRADRSLFVAGCFLVGFTLFSAFNLGCAQKYYDALVLFFLAWRTLPRAAGDRWSRATLAALILLFSAYHVSLLLLSSDESRAGTQILSSSP